MGRGFLMPFERYRRTCRFVLNPLREARKAQDKAETDYEETDDAGKRQAVEESSRAVRPIMATWEGNAQAPKEILHKVIPNDGSSSLE